MRDKQSNMPINIIIFYIGLTKGLRQAFCADD